MNILFLSNIIPAPWAGPTYSVPQQIESLSNQSNVLWFNIVNPDDVRDDWKHFFDDVQWRKLPYYMDLTDNPFADIEHLPKPFSTPDLVIVEQFYCFGGKSIIHELINKKIPYIIIPRGELTRSAQKKKLLKKKVANMLFFKRFSKHAYAIQYLTKQEQVDSGARWNKSYVILGNGTNIPQTTHKEFRNAGKVKGIMIGRLDPFHKGIDLLIDACCLIKDELEDNCTISIYGPDRLGKLHELKNAVLEKNLQNIIHFGDALYGDEKTNALLNSDVFIITSRFEGHPMSLIEAMSFGIPCVATTGSNMCEEVENSNAGWCAENDTNSIAEALSKMLKEKDLIKEKGNNAKALATTYSWDSLAFEAMIEYNRLLSDKGES